MHYNQLRLILKLRRGWVKLDYLKFDIVEANELILKLRK